LNIYQKAYSAFKRKEFAEALSLFERYAEQDQTDVVSQKFIVECKTLLKKPFEESQQHIWLVEHK
jgi:hypothetical protein